MSKYLILNILKVIYEYYKLIFNFSIVQKMYFSREFVNLAYEDIVIVRMVEMQIE